MTQPQAPLGGPGESCRARADCKGDLKCVNQVCTDAHEGETCGASADCGGELKCISNKCTSVAGGHAGGGGSGSGGAGGNGGTSDWMKYSPLDGSLHPYAGFSIGGGFDTLGLTGNFLSGGFNTFDGALLFALEAGLFMGHHQLSVDIAPFTYIYDGKANGSTFEAIANYAYFIPLTDMGDIHFYWPIRFGAGIVAGGDNTFSLAFFQLRADVLGFAVQVGHVVADFHLPSFRYAITDKNGSQLHMLDWIFGVSVGYAF